MFLSPLDYFADFFDHPDATDERKENARVLCDMVNDLLIEAEAHGVEIKTNWRTKTVVSGEQYGGFRPKDCPIGAPGSAHKQGMGVDIFDPDNELDNYVTDAILTAHDLYRESPGSTKGWCHLQTRPTKNRTFLP